MNFKEHAIILSVIDYLHQQGSWTGKTHVQKALSLLRDKGAAKAPFQFVLYRHGPYSFEVEAELEQMRSYGAIEIEPNSQGYGVVLNPGPMANLAEQLGKITDRQKRAIEDVCGFVGNKGVGVLEQLATASWIRVQEKKKENQDVAERLNELKPHIPVAAAQKADKTVHAWLKQKI